MDKLITIYLSDHEARKQGVTEHLRDYFQQGWTIQQIVAVGAGVGDSYDSSRSHSYVAGWLAVSLRQQPESRPPA